MLLLDRQTGATAEPRTEANRPSASTGRVQLRLRAEGRVLELPPGKTTIGSSPRCNIRIEKPGVQPLHCLIVEGPEGFRVRNWVANTTLNGMPFEESALAVGDCLSLGQVELEVIDPRAGQTQPAVEAPVVETKDAEQFRVGRDRARIRSRRLLDALRQQRSSHHELCQQVLKLQESHLDAIADQNEINGKLESSLAELAEADGKLGDFQAVEAARQQLASRNEQLGFEIGELLAQINELKQRQTEATSDQQKIADDRAALQEQHRQLSEANDRLQSEMGQVVNEKAAAEEQCRQLIEASARLRIEIGNLTNEKGASDEQCWKLAAEKSQLQSEFDRLADEKYIPSEERRQLDEVNSRLQNDVVRLANEKAAADEQNRQLAQQKSQLQNEVSHLTDQKAELEAEREGLRGQNEQLLGEAREQARERSSLDDERNALCHERSELRQENEALRSRIEQLNDENSAMAVGKLTLIDERDALDREVTELRVRAAQLSAENTFLATAKSSLAEEQARLIAEKNRLAEIEHEMSAAVAGREDTSAELYRALLQVAEMQERDEQGKAIVEAYELLRKEHDHLHEESDQLKEQIAHLSKERAAVEVAWQSLSAEAATLDESQQQLAEENAAIVARLDEARQQLEQAQQEQATWASAAAELERERAAKLQAEADVAAAMADGERRLAEQERRFAEQAQQFADQSSQFNERLQQQAEQSRRIQELESQLAAAESRAATAAELAASRFATDHAEAVSQVASEQPAEFRSSSARADSVSHDEPKADGLDAVTSRKSLDEAPTGEVVWDRPAKSADAWHAVVAEVPTNDSAAERAGDAWADASEFGAAAEEPHPWAAKVSPQAVVDAGTFGDDDDASLAPEPVDDSASTDRFSAVEQVTEQPEIAIVEPIFAKLEVADQGDAESETVSKPKAEPVSFIERYSHLLEEDAPWAKTKPERADEFAPARPIAPILARPEAAIVPPAKSEDEESIEQYMAKLLQRVRGDSEGGKAAREQPTRMPLNAPTANPVEESPEDSAPLTVTAPVTHASDQPNAVNVEPMVAGEKWQRRVSSPAPATNLGALRALANETARLAISRHELRKLRRKAVTKVIVSTLAGVTSLWLMLDSEDCRNMQFITACAALVVAVYWACETFRTLINSMRIKPYEGADGEETALPIDVEGKSS